MPLRSFYPQGPGNHDGGSYSTDQVSKHSTKNAANRDDALKAAKAKAAKAAEQSRKHPV